ncbi:MAG: C13 family peptidase, partial [Gammaproteobacteria bacterium]
LFQLPQQSLWYHDYSVETKSTDINEDINIENTFYRQNDLIKKAADNLSPERTGLTDLYFLGFAGYADEDVFMNEAKLAKQVFDTRFDTKDRSLLLINNSKTVEKLPLANAHNLESAVMVIAETMNPEEDILFLMLSSHGSKDHKLSIDYYPLQMNDIDPGKIKKILDNSGIKWRVIVVSACYSGGFIEALIDENTLIMTASDKDKSSFGCGHDGDYTYFGDALFGKHLRVERDFSTAFYSARQDIEARETEESLESSMPQIRIGRNIEKQLLLLTDRLE